MITIVDIPSASDATPMELLSESEYVDLPRIGECLDDEETGIYSTDPDYHCQTGCDEESFVFITEPGDHIPLQFHASDNDVGIDGEWWDGGATYHLIAIEIMRPDGTVAWTGDTALVADDFNTGNSGSPYQNINISVDKVIALTGLDCWYFRAKVMFSYARFSIVNSREEPVTPTLGYTYLSLDNNQVWQWNGTGWVSIGPNETGEVWYVQSEGQWYKWQGWGWTVLISPPPASADEFDYYTTMSYRLRRCGEEVVHVRSEHVGTDCATFFHGTSSHRYVMQPPDEDTTLLDYFFEDDVYNHMDVPIGFNALSRFSPYLWTRTPYGWSYSTAGPFLLMNDSIQVSAGHTITATAYAPGTGYWSMSLDPGIAFDNTIIMPWAFQHDFKVLGSVERNAFAVVRNLTKNGRLISSSTVSRSRVTTFGIPEQVASLFSAVFTSPRFYVNGELFTEAGDISKNNEDGRMWWLDVVVSSGECISSESCST